MFSFMTQDEAWIKKYNEVVAFIETNKRNPSKHSDEERGWYLNWLKYNSKLIISMLKVKILSDKRNDFII